MDSVHIWIYCHRRWFVVVVFWDHCLDTFQVYLSRAAGADAILIILSAIDYSLASQIYDLANKLNLTLEVRKISIGEVISSIKNGKLKEAFGAGTAATVAPIKTIGYESKDYDLPAINSKSYSSIFLEELNNIKYGKSPDLFNWINKV